VQVSRADYRRQTRKNVCVDQETYDELLEAKDTLEAINKLFPFTEKVISQHDTVKYLCQFFMNEYQDVVIKKGVYNFLKKGA
tara:strand:- start:1356 stop:1601 length:246 start_codon:yes stop_codon:yes gene_type:complete